jgi:hypothetical protein
MLRRMTEDDFWTLVAASGTRPGDRQAREDWLGRRLLELPADAVAAFQARLEAAVDTAYTWPLWDAAARIEDGWCSDDGFVSFRLWLVARGRTVYEAAVADPDTLAGLSELRALAGRRVEDWDDEEWPEWERLDRIAREVWNQTTGRDGEDFDAFYDAVDAVDAADLDTGDAARTRDPEGGEPSGRRGEPLPRLAALFPRPDGLD